MDEIELRHWLVDYLVTNIGCSPDEVDFDAPLKDLGVTSRDAVVLSGELAEVLGRQVSPVEFWQHPTINALARFLTGAEPEADADNAGAVLDHERSSMDEPIAVIGLGCRLPGEICGPEALWRFLCEGRSAVGEVPPDRWSAFDDGSPEAAAALSGTTRWGSFLTDIDAFDAEFFEIWPREATKIDPQQRLLLEVAHEALEHAGIPADSLRRTQTGVFAGACVSEYGYLASADLSQVDAWSGTGSALSIIANRVSYFFDLRGPSVTVDTACSSSLVAVHLACQSLRTGDSNLAIAAGVNLLLSPVVTRSLDQANAMSPTGGCHAFDASADGFVRGEGCGVAVLKRLGDALSDGDRVLAVVRGSAVNQDGRSNGLMAPNPAAQMAVLRAAYANAGVEPREVDYVEAHGSGTLLGDPIEARALGTVLGRARPQNVSLLIGAIKSNLGTLEAAAGIASFIKAVLAVQHGHIPPNLGFQTPNPHIPFENLRLKVVAEPTDWPSTEHPRRAGVSSLGFGGTNAHVVLEQGPLPDPVALQPEPAVTTLVVSGKSVERVGATAGVLAEWMDGEGAGVSLADVAHTLNHHRSRHGRFATVCARDRVQAVAGLRALAGGQPAPGVFLAPEGPRAAGTVFVYSGQGSQWAGMGRQLLADEPAFASAVADLEPMFVEQVGFSLQQVLADGEPVSGDARVQPVLVGMQLALTELWRSYGVEPDAVIGHSVGEVSAAVVAGALSPADGLAVIAALSRLMSQLSTADPILPEFRSALSHLAPITPKIPLISTSGHAGGDAPVFDADYWAANVRNPVHLTQAVAAAGADHGTFIEISPHPLLTEAITDTLASATDTGPALVTATMNRELDQTLFFHSQLAAVGITPRDGGAGRFVDVPPTPWLHSRYWVPRRSTDRWMAGAHPLLGLHVEMPSQRGHLWQATVGTEVLSWLGDHMVHGQAVMATAAFAEMALAAGCEVFGLPLEAVAVGGLEIEEMLLLEPGTRVTTQAIPDGDRAILLEVHSRSADGTWCRHAVVRVEAAQPDGIGGRPALPGNGGTAVSPAEFYGALRRTGAQHGQAFAALTHIVRIPGGFAEVQITLPEEAGPHHGYRVHPVMLDAALQSVVAAMPAESLADKAYLPMSVETIRVSGDIGQQARCRAEVVDLDDGAGMLGRVTLTDDAGMPTAEITGIRLRPIERQALPIPLDARSGDEQIAIDDWNRSAMPAGDWSELPDQDRYAKLEIGLQAMLAHELRVPPSKVDVGRPFPELGLDSMMAMSLLKEAKKLVGIDLSPTMLWNHPTISSLATYLAELLAPQQEPAKSDADVTPPSAGSVLDALFDSVESASAGSESGI